MKIRRSSLIQAALVTSLGYIVVQLDVTIVNVALPTFAREFQADISALQWIPDAYVIVFAALLLAAGGLSDRFGSQKINLAGLVIFLFSSLTCAFSSSIEIMITGRIGQGVGAALILPSSLALLSAASSGNTVLRTKAIGWWSAIGGISIWHTFAAERAHFPSHRIGHISVNNLSFTLLFKKKNNYRKHSNK